MVIKDVITKECSDREDVIVTYWRVLVVTAGLPRRRASSQ
jgi:hypothetical protein